jgi:hypothetical protein
MYGQDQSIVYLSMNTTFHKALSRVAMIPTFLLIAGVSLVRSLPIGQIEALLDALTDESLSMQIIVELFSMNYRVSSCFICYLTGTAFQRSPGFVLSSYSLKTMLLANKFILIYPSCILLKCSHS